MKNLTKLYLTGLAALLVACTDVAHPNTPEAPGILPGLAEAGISDMAQAVSRAMTFAPVRQDMLKAMRASSHVEHQLILAEYLASRQGGSLLERTADVFGVSPFALLARVGELDEVAQLVISAPLRKHRLAWQGGPNIGTAGTWDSDAQDLVVFHPDGSQQRTTQLATLREYDAFFLIRPRESWATRIGRQADVPGPVIQEPHDGEIAVVSTYQVEGREPIAVDHGLYESEEELREALAQAEAACGECGMDGQVLPHPHYYRAGATRTVLRNLMLTTRTEWTTEEVEITIWFVNADGEKIRRKTRKDGVVDEWFQNDLRLTAHLYSPIRFGADFYIKAVETDFGLDDDLGERTYDYRHGPGVLTMWKLNVKLHW